MGLAQQFRFTYVSTLELQKFLGNFLEDFTVDRKESGLLVVTPKEGNKFIFELTIEKYGLYTHRSGQYFEFLGMLLENLTGTYGQVEVIDE